MPTIHHVDPSRDLEVWINHRDAAAFTRLVEQYSRLVTAVCHRQLNDYDAAEDATQAVFIILGKQAATIRQREHLASWLHGVAISVCRNARRAAARRRRYEESAAQFQATVQSTASNESTWTDIRPHLDEALAALSPTQRDALIGHFLEGRPQAAVAEDLGISEGAAKQRIHYGLDKLRSWFARRGLTVGGGVLAAGLAGETAAAEPALVTTCTLAALQPATATPGALQLAQATMSIAVGKLVWLSAAMLLALIGGGTAVMLGNRSQRVSIYVAVNHPQAADTNPGTIDLPLKSIAAAVRKAGPGTTVFVNGGIYRETVLVSTSGAKDKPIVIKSMPGERVIVSGAEPIVGWKRCTTDDVFGNQHADLIYTVDVTALPDKLIESSSKRVIYSLSRLPEAGLWQPSAANGRHVFSDPAHLIAADEHAYADWTLMAFNQASGVGTPHTAFTYDPGKHQITLENGWSKWADINTNRDTYWFENHPVGINAPGQFAYQKTENGWRCWVWPLTMKDGQPVIEQVVRSECLTPDKVGFLVIDGLEFCFAHGEAIGPKVTLTDSTIQNCYIHDCGSYGIGLAKSNRVTVRRSIFREVDRGILQAGGSDCVIEENDVGWCLVDGIDAADGIRNLHIRRNFIHDNCRYGDPDNLQLWNDVDGVWIEDNVLLNGGQIMMAYGVKNAHVLNNLLVGSHAAGAILRSESGVKVYKLIDPTYKPATRSALVKAFEASSPDVVEFTHNTVCATGLMPTNWSGTGFDVHDNVLAPLHSMPLYAINSLRTATIDGNLLWPGVVNERIADISTITKTGEGDQAVLDIKSKRLGLSALQKLGLEKNGLVADPQFINAPKFYAVSYHGAIAASTPSKLVIRGQAGNHIAVGDHVEIGFDGVVRTVTHMSVVADALITDAPGVDFPASDVAKDELSTITFDPPLKAVSHFAVGVANWSDKTDFTWNLQLNETSPGHNKARDGKDLGSSLNFQNYVRGDFDGDGQRDLPELPTN